MKVFVLGCGPAGLFAAHAIYALGHDLTILSKKRRSEMYGAQNLLASIPGLTGDSFKVSYALNGTWDSYRQKVYGDGDVYGTNIETSGAYEAWDVRAAYHKAWDLYADAIEPMRLGYGELWDLIDRRAPDLVISTIPAPTLCYNRAKHNFVACDVWAIGDAPERGQFAPRVITEPNTIAYDGTTEHGWYRASFIAGYHTVEWPDSIKPPMEVARLTKPISNTCDCFVDAVPGTTFWRVGRYGSWDRHTYSHDGYWKTITALTETS